MYKSCYFFHRRYRGAWQEGKKSDRLTLQPPPGASGGAGDVSIALNSSRRHKKKRRQMRRNVGLEAALPQKHCHRQVRRPRPERCSKSSRRNNTRGTEARLLETQVQQEVRGHLNCVCTQQQILLLLLLCRTQALTRDHL